MLRRQRARGSLAEYARSVDIPGAPAAPDDPETEMFKPVESAVAAHHMLMLNAIEECMTTPGGRLMLFLPPGSAKSSYASVVGPSWYLSKFPASRIILASYGVEIAEMQSRKARSLCRDPRQVAIWPDRPKLNADQRAVGEWALSNGSEYQAAGLRTGITGRRANGLIIDDPVKNREEADSPVIRAKTFAEYTDSATTRLLPNGWAIICQTRWHADDLAGSILPEDYAGESGRILCRDGQTWNVLNIQAKCEREDDPLGRKIGEYLWREWFPESHWAQWENNPRAARTWNALFQQRPSAQEGIEFKREWFRWYDPDTAPGKPGGRPSRLAHYGASDYATLEDRGDFTEHGVVGIDAVRNFWFLDWWYGQKTTDVSINHFVQLVRVWSANKWWHEGGPIDNAIAPAITAAMREATKRSPNKPVFTPLEALTSVKNKALKLAAFQAVASEGRVYLPLRRPWATRLVDQLCAFPTARHDDAADVVGLLGRGVDAMIQPYVPTEAPKPMLVPFTAAWLEWEGDEFERKVRYS